MVDKEELKLQYKALVVENHQIRALMKENRANKKRISALLKE